MTPSACSYDSWTQHLATRAMPETGSALVARPYARAPIVVTGVAGIAAAPAFAAETESGLASAARTCSVNSFTGATLVLLADGTKKPIRDVKVGNKVLATDPQTGETAARPVTKLIVHSGNHTMVDVRLADGTTITATDRHPFWDATTGEFTYALDLRPGDKVRESDGTLLAVAGTRIYDADVTAYNLTVDGIHTYYAGATPVLVHNSCFSAADALGDPGSLEGLAPSQIDDLARNAGYEIKAGSASATNPATRYYLPGTRGSQGFRVLPEGVPGQEGIKAGPYLKFFGGPLHDTGVGLSWP